VTPNDLRELRGQRRLILLSMRRLASYPDPNRIQLRALNDCRHALAVVDSRLEEAMAAREEEAVLPQEEPANVGSD
jgi:hypothetical protein